MDHLEQSLVALAPVVEPEDRSAQPLLVAPVGIGGVGARDPAPDIRVVADGGGECDMFALEEDGLEDEDVRKVGTAIERIVENIQVTGTDFIAEVTHHRFQGGWNGAQEGGQSQPLGDQSPPRIAQGRGEVHAALEHAGAGGSENRDRHLVGRGTDRVPEHFTLEGVHGIRHQHALVLPPRPLPSPNGSHRALRALAGTEADFACGMAKPRSVRRRSFRGGQTGIDRRGVGWLSERGDSGFSWFGAEDLGQERSKA